MNPKLKKCSEYPPIHQTSLYIFPKLVAFLVTTMLAKEITDDLEIFTKKFMEDEGITDYERTIEGQPDKGANYGSEIVFFKVTTVTEQTYNLVMKTTKRSEDMIKAYRDGAADKREMHIYGKVIPALRQMLADFKADYQLENVPRTFFICTEDQHETALMEDLRPCGYKLWDKQKPMNLEHIKTVLKNCAMFHASSMALRMKNPQLFEDLTEDMDNVLKYFIDDDGLVKTFKGNFEDALNILVKVGREDIVEKLRHVPDDIKSFVGGDIEEEDRVVITHGDCWTNNIMFKYKDSDIKKPTGLIFLDFQVSCLGSPALDLSQYIYSTFDADTLEKHFHEFLRYYHDSLSSTLRYLDIKPDEVFTFQQLEEHWRKYAIRGLILASTMMKVQLASPENAPELVENEEEPDRSTLKFENAQENGAYEKRIQAIYENYAKTCLN